jgi:nicotinamidase-related amidase
MIVIDIEVQRDIFQPGGSLYDRAITPVTGNIYRLFNWAGALGVPIISTMLLVRPAERGPFGPIPHLVEDTPGARKLPRTILPDHVNLGLAHNTDLPPDLLDTHPQVIFEKRDTDLFHHARAERLITELPKDLTFILCGAGMAHGIKQAVIGLRSRGFPVVVVEDAVADLHDPMAEMAWLQIMAKQATPLSTAETIRRFVPTRKRRPVPRSVESILSQ